MVKKKSALLEAILFGVKFVYGVSLLIYAFILVVILIVVYAFKDEKVNSNKHLHYVLTKLRGVAGIK